MRRAAGFAVFDYLEEGVEGEVGEPAFEPVGCGGELGTGGQGVLGLS